MRTAGLIAVGAGFGALIAAALIGGAMYADQRARRRREFRRYVVLTPLRVGQAESIVARCGKCGAGMTSKQIAGVGAAGRLCSRCLGVSSR